MKIVSLLPSATELIVGMGLGDQLVGVSHCCDFPATVIGLPAVTSTLIDKALPSGEIDHAVREHLSGKAALYDLDIDLLAALEPDLVVSQALCDVCAVAGADAELAVRALPNPPILLNLEPNSLADVVETGRMIGIAAGAAKMANNYMDQLQRRFDNVAERTRNSGAEPRRLVFLDWIDPPFVGGHWMNDLITMAGGQSVINIAGRPSRATNWNEIGDAAPKVIVIACCGFDVTRTIAEIEAVEGLVTRLRNFIEDDAEVHIFDGHGLFSNAGPRLAESLELLAHHLHPKIHPVQSWFSAYSRPNAITLLRDTVQQA